MANYKYNEGNLNFEEKKRGESLFIKFLKYVTLVLVLAVCNYFIYTLLVDTNEEKKIRYENSVMAQAYQELTQESEVLENTIKNLQYKERQIYNEIYNAELPMVKESINDVYQFLQSNSDAYPDEILMVTSDNLREASSEADEVAKGFEDVLKRFEQSKDEFIYVPSIVPIKKFSVGQIGASVGEKINPFYKTSTMHYGVDLIAPEGADIIATAAGRIQKVSRAGREEGSIVEINHGNGYITRYTHLGDILVRGGKRVKKGELIGKVGMSGITFAPHLHYEVVFNEKKVDPVNYFFSDLNPELFKEMVITASNTGQSLD